MEEDYEPTVQHQRRLNPKIHDIIKKEVEKLLYAGSIYPISDSPWETDIRQKDEKSSKNGQNRARNGKAWKSQSQIKVKVNPEKSTVKTGADTEEYLMGPPLRESRIVIQVSKAVDEIVTNAVDWAMQAPLRERFRDLPEADMKEILHNRMWESKSDQTHEDHMTLYEALEKSMARDNSDQLLSDLAEARKKKKKETKASPKTPHALHLILHLLIHHHRSPSRTRSLGASGSL
ncbi:hypothetical protein Tco_0084222 [Tanacetum coccineum]